MNLLNKFREKELRNITLHKALYYLYYLLFIIFLNKFKIENNLPNFMHKKRVSNFSLLKNREYKHLYETSKEQ